jgi:hypothetical protein
MEINSNSDTPELVLSPVEKFKINRPTVFVIIGEIEKYEESHTLLSNELDTVDKLKNKIQSSFTVRIIFSFYNT